MRAPRFYADCRKTMFDDQSVLNTEAGDAVIETDGTDTPSLEERLAQADARADENYNKFLLATADFENYKKRARRDIDSMVSLRRRAMLERFLPVLDNLERALSYDTSSEALRNGLEQTLRGFEAVLAAEGVKAIDVKDKPFDPHVAEAIATAPREGVEDDVVIEVAEKGYRLGEELLRPAKVVVAKNAG
jgi:molecular chaperone GrpE